MRSSEQNSSAVPGANGSPVDHTPGGQPTELNVRRKRRRPRRFRDDDLTPKPSGNSKVATGDKESLVESGQATAKTKRRKRKRTPPTPGNHPAEGRETTPASERKGKWRGKKGRRRKAAEIRTDVNPLEPSDEEAQRLAEERFAAERTARAAAARDRGAGEVHFPVYSVAELMELDFTTEYLVSQILAKGQPCIIAGAPKSMKTTLAIDLSLSLATKTPFLGKFAVDQKRRVLMMTGESGGATVQETVRRICHAKGFDPDTEVEDATFSHRVPRIHRQEHLDALQTLIGDVGAEVLVIDPLYLAMDGSEAGNLFLMGAQLLGLSEVCQEAGVTLVLVHHTRKNPHTPLHEPLELTEIAWAGSPEFARQWLLLSRRLRYRPDSGSHQLWLSGGGSAGHGGCWGVDIEEGVFAEGQDRKYEVTMMDEEEARDADIEAREGGSETGGDPVHGGTRPGGRARQRSQRPRRGSLEAICDAIREVYRQEEDNAVLTKSGIADFAGRNRGDIDRGIEQMLKTDELVAEQFKPGKSRRLCDGYRYVGVDEDE